MIIGGRGRWSVVVFSVVIALWTLCVIPRGTAVAAKDDGFFRALTRTTAREQRLRRGQRGLPESIRGIQSHDFRQERQLGGNKNKDSAPKKDRKRDKEKDELGEGVDENENENENDGQQEASGGRVSGGREAPPSEEFPRGAYPFMSTLLRVEESSSSLTMTCAGSLVAPNVILTAGHCVGFFSAVRVGVFNRSAVPNEGHLFVVESVVRNDMYQFGGAGDSFLLRHDVALVTFYGTVLDIPTVPISLDPQLLPLNQSSSLNNSSSSPPLVIVGWGQTNEDDLAFADDPNVRMDGTVNVLREAFVVYVPNQDCRQAPNIDSNDQPGSTVLPHMELPFVNTTMSETPSLAPSLAPPSPPLSYQNLVFDDNICVASPPPSPSGRPFLSDQEGTLNPASGICNGDSGGPLLLNASETNTTISGNDNGLLLVGVGSWTVGCGRAEYPSVFFRTTSSVEWLTANLCHLSRGGPTPREWNCTAFSTDAGLPNFKDTITEDLRNTTATIIINITLDDRPLDTGFLLQSMDRDGTVLAYSPPGTYSIAHQNIIKAISGVPVLVHKDLMDGDNGMIDMQRLATYRFVLLDLLGDGWDGSYEVRARLDDASFTDDNVAGKVDSDDAADQPPKPFQLLAFSANLRINLDGQMATQHVFELASTDSTAPSTSPSVAPTAALNEDLPFLSMELTFVDLATAAYVGWKMIAMSDEQVRAHQPVGRLIPLKDSRFSKKIYLRDALPGQFQVYRLDLQYDLTMADDSTNATWPHFEYRISLGRRQMDRDANETIAETELYQGRFLAPSPEEEGGGGGVLFRQEEFLFTVVWYQAEDSAEEEEEKDECTERSKSVFVLLKNVQDGRITQHDKTCKWLRRKAPKARGKICSQDRSRNAHVVCPKTCKSC